MAIRRPQGRGPGGPSGMCGNSGGWGTGKSGDVGSNIYKPYRGSAQTVSPEGMGWMPKSDTRGGSEYLSTQDTPKTPRKEAPGTWKGSDMGRMPRGSMGIGGGPQTSPVKVRK